MTTLCSYDLNGKKLSFANWISNLSPQETPFTSMTGKESINQTLFQWQTDSLAPAGDNAQVEGAVAVEGGMKTTSVKQNITQILRKTVKVSDTANALANYGRGKELQYQMEKAGKEIKRDLEWTFLHNVGSKSETTGATPTGRETAGFRGLVAPFGVPCPETKAIVHSAVATDDTITEAELFGLTYNLYLAGSRADIIMFHPKYASFFSSLQEKAGTRQRIFENTPKFSVYVSTVIDPLGQEYKLIPNRWMPIDAVYFFNSSDWTQMVLRAPSRTKLAKDGSYEKWMLEMEVGLRHRHPYASGILDLKKDAHKDSAASVTNTLDSTTKTIKFTVGTTETGDLAKAPATAVATVGQPLTIKLKTAANPHTLKVLKDGNVVDQVSQTASTATDWNTTAHVVKSSLTVADAGLYTIQVTATKDGVEHTFVSQGLALTVGAAAPINA